MLSVSEMGLRGSDSGRYTS